MLRNSEILVPSSRFSIKPVAIRPERLSNYLIHLPSRTHRAPFNRHILILLVTRNSEVRVPKCRLSINPVVIPPEILSNSPIHFPSRTRRALSISLLCFYTKHPHLPKFSKNCTKRPSKSTSNFLKLVAIRREMLSNFLNDLPSRTRRALSNRQIFSSI